MAKHDSTKLPYEIWQAECGEGWKSLYEPLIQLCEHEGLTILQVKEKFGGLRFYVGGDSSDDVERQIAWAEAKSLEICELCGQPGELFSSRGWMMTRCPEHRKEQEGG